ncbi:hypothetical protein L1887_29606 [Cichorium endivia]|nr:hypothetical protein L1887_29606 [Cichorium endivia]
MVVGETQRCWWLGPFMEEDMNVRLVLGLFVKFLPDPVPYSLILSITIYSLYLHLQIQTASQFLNSSQFLFLNLIILQHLNRLEKLVQNLVDEGFEGNGCCTRSVPPDLVCTFSSKTWDNEDGEDFEGSLHLDVKEREKQKERRRECERGIPSKNLFFLSLKKAIGKTQ